MRDEIIETMVIACLKSYFSGGEGKEYIKLPSNPEEWEQLSLFLRCHNLEYFFYGAVSSKKIDIEVPKQIIRQWDVTSKKTIAFNALYEQELSSVLYGLQEVNIYPIVLKGIALHRLYDNILTRPSSDIDIFITRNEYQTVRNYLLDQGFRYGLAKGFRGTCEQYIEIQENYSTEISFQKILGSTAINIDLHWELDGIYDGSPLEKLFPIDKYPWHQHIQQDQWDDISFKTLKPEMQFIYLLAHFALHHQFQGAKWFLDLCMFIHKQGKELDWEFVDSIVQEPDCRKIIGVTLRIIENLLGIKPVGVPSWQHFWNGYGMPGEFNFYKKRLFSEPEKTGQYMANVLLPLKFTEKLKVLAYYMFNKEAIILQRTNNESNKILPLMQPFYIILRVFKEKKK